MHARRRYHPHEEKPVQIVIQEDSDKSHSKPYYNPPIEQNKYSQQDKYYNSPYVESDEELFPFLAEKDILTVMTSRDRTQEFGAAIRTLAGGAIGRATTAKNVQKAQALQSYSQFMQSARIISKNISSTYSKLEKLALLAKKKSLFDDRPAEIQELTYIIKGDLGSLNQQIGRLGELPRGRRHIHSHSSSVVLGLQSRLATMSSHFKQVLEVRSENLKHQNTRRERFTKGLPPVKGSTSLLDEEHVSIEMDGMGAASSSGAGGGQMMTGYQRQQMAMRDDTDVYLAERAETMHNIESTIVELGGIFQQLAHMVKEQDETISRIDANVEDAEMNIEAAHSQILKYFQSVTNNRMLMFKIFGVLIFFFIFFVVFLA